jgi:hypothetical protein
MKVKTVGKKLLFFLLATATALSIVAGQLTLRITSTDGEPLKQVGMGQPFVVEVCASGVQADKKSGSMFPLRTNSPQIKGLDKFTVRSAGTQMHMINGTGSIFYRYRVRADRPGGYHIGPATIELNQETLSSNKVEFIVGDQPAPVAERAKVNSGQKKNQSAMLVASVDKKKAMLGEKIVYTLRYYYLDRTIQLKAIVPPKFTGFSAGKVRGPVEGKELVNGTNYWYGQWQWDLYPNVAGNATIPCAAADVDVMDTAHALSVLSAFLGGTAEQKQLFSNTLTMYIGALPPYHEKVDAIGKFVHVSAKVDQAMVKEGEGFVLTLELEGEGNIEQIPVPVLKNMPQAFKWYDSKNYMVETKTEKMRKRTFEYIVQGLQAGSFQIPVQKFTYFDTDTHAYKTRETLPIDIKVKQTALSKKRSSDKTFQQKKVERNMAKQLLPLAASDRMRVSSDWQMSIGILLVLVFLPFMVQGFAITTTYIYGIGWYKNSWNKRNLFAKARAELKKAESQKSNIQINHIFINLLARQWGIPHSLLSQEKINERLVDAGFDKEYIARFDEFFTTIIGLVYAREQRENMSEIIAQSYEWLTLFEEKL